jgi:hypothetical protein
MVSVARCISPVLVRIFEAELPHLNVVMMFNDAVNKSLYTLSNGRMVSEFDRVGST